jgi:hypothetical protein
VRLRYSFCLVDCSFLQRAKSQIHMSAAGAAGEQVIAPAKAAYYQCDYCNKKAALQCSRCKAAVFCNKECLKKAWPKHKKNCVAKEAIPIDGKQMQEAIFALQILDKKNVGKLSGTSMFNVIGSFLGLDPAVGPEGIPKAQQRYMNSDRIPTFLAACSGSYDVVIAESGEVFKDSIRDLVDGTIMYVKYGRGKLRNEKSSEFRYHSPGSLAAERPPGHFQVHRRRYLVHDRTSGVVLVDGDALQRKGFRFALVESWRGRRFYLFR